MSAREELRQRGTAGAERNNRAGRILRGSGIRVERARRAGLGRQLLADGRSGIADLVHRLLKLLVRDLQVLGPVLNLVRFMHVDFRAILHAFEFSIVHVGFLSEAKLDPSGLVPVCYFRLTATAGSRWPASAAAVMEDAGESC
jgi:hypothetical protein